MNARTASIALLAALVAAPAFADVAQPAGLTRAEVSAEFIRARNAGELDFSNEFLSPVVQARKVSASAAAVKVENLPATAAGKRDDQSAQAVRSDKTPG
jgi:hypothetical protein